MRILRIIAVFVLSLMGFSLSAQQLDSLTRRTLSDKLGEYLSAIETEGMAKFFKPIAKRFGLTQEFAELGIFTQ